MITALQLPLTGLAQAPNPLPSTADVDTRLSFDEILQGMQPGGDEALAIVLLAPETAEDVDAQTAEAATQQYPQSPAVSPPTDTLRAWILAGSVAPKVDAQLKEDTANSAPSALKGISPEGGESVSQAKAVPSPLGGRLDTVLSLSKGTPNDLTEKFTGAERQPKISSTQGFPDVNIVDLPDAIPAQSLAEITTLPQALEETFEVSLEASPQKTDVQRLQKSVPESAVVQTTALENFSAPRVAAHEAEDHLFSQSQEASKSVDAKQKIETEATNGTIETILAFEVSDKATPFTANEKVENAAGANEMPLSVTQTDAAVPVVEQAEIAQVEASEKETVVAADLDDALEPIKKEEAAQEIDANIQASGFVPAPMRVETETLNNVAAPDPKQTENAQVETRTVKEPVFSQPKETSKPVQENVPAQNFSVPAAEMGAEKTSTQKAATTQSVVKQETSTIEAQQVSQPVQADKAVATSDALKQESAAKETTRVFPQQAAEKVDLSQSNVVDKTSTQQVSTNTVPVDAPIVEDGDDAQVENTELTGVAQRSVLGRAEVFAPQAGTMSVRDAGMNDVDVVDQIFEKLNLKMDGNPSSIRLQLNPEELGEIDIRVRHVAEGVRVTFAAEQRATVQLLETRIDQLQQAFKNAGLTVADLNIGQQGNFERQGGFQQPRETNVAMPVSRETAEGKVEEIRSQPRQAGGVDYLI